MNQAVMSFAPWVLVAISLLGVGCGDGGGSSSGTKFSPSTSIPHVVTWEENMVLYGDLHCSALKGSGSFDEKLAATYYDAQRVFYQISDYTGDSKWISCANAAEKIYRDQYVVSNQGAVPGYWNFSRGLLLDFLHTGDDGSKNALSLLSTNAAFARDDTDAAATASADISREVAYAILSYLDAEQAGGGARGRLALLVSQALSHIDQWFNSRNSYINPFRVGLTAEALIEYVEKTGDPRVLPALVHAADGLWSRTWVPQSHAFIYATRRDDSGGPEPAPDLNLLIAPLYGWLYHKTGEARFIERGDQIFAGGVQGAYLQNAKQFNQNYRWSFEYVRWRTLPPL